ncbi:MAG: ABC-F family ATP-binding cassette domain-containing protein [Deltaproteobacteria bacterium]|nr:ABC-F family ATP-binding cassette domain-containing protein [Deltaproteobacteria bacterium]
MLLRLDDVSRSFGSRSLFSGVSLEVRAGDRIGLVGANGAGKTTLLRIAAGDDPPDAGRRSVRRGARVGILRQEIDPAQDCTVREETGRALAHVEDLERELRDLEAQMTEAGEVSSDLAEAYDAANSRFEHAGGFEREARIERILAGLGFDEEARGSPLRTFSGGWLMRVELAKLLLAEPDVLLLDEPTNHLDLPSIQWFEETLTAFRGGVIVISHDRTFLRRHVRQVAELALGRFLVYPGGYDYYLEERVRRKEELLARKKSLDRKTAETERFIERFRSKASKARQVQSRVKALERQEQIELPDEDKRRIRLKIPEPSRAGAIPIALEDIHKRYDDKIVYDGIDLQIERGDRVALVGPNGAGKSTLLRILAGVLPFEKGKRALGHRVEVAFYAQHQLESLDPKRTVLGELESCATMGDATRLRGHLGAFLFSGDDVEKRVSVLSGGEKARLALAKLLLRPSNVLVLDEPTNHLDVQACEVLEDALRGYKGTLVFISHDRAFINSLASRVIEVENGRLRFFPGNYDDYLRRIAEPKKTKKSTPEALPTAPPDPKRSAPAEPASNKERRRDERERRKARQKVERRIEKIEAEILGKESAVSELGWKLADPGLFKDPDRLRGLEAERTELGSAIEALYAEYERLGAELSAMADADCESAAAS